jgi:hypothetical protein
MKTIIISIFAFAALASCAKKEAVTPELSFNYFGKYTVTQSNVYPVGTSVVLVTGYAVVDGNLYEMETEGNDKAESTFMPCGVIDFDRGNGATGKFIFTDCAGNEMILIKN